MKDKLQKIREMLAEMPDLMFAVEILDVYERFYMDGYMDGFKDGMHDMNEAWKASKANRE